MNHAHKGPGVANLLGESALGIGAFKQKKVCAQGQNTFQSEIGHAYRTVLGIMQAAAMRRIDSDSRIAQKTGIGTTL